MMLVYLDASVWVKRYVIEEGSDRVRRWFREGPVVATSSFALIEVMSTLVRKERAGELATDAMNTSLDAAEADLDHFATVPVSEAVIDAARRGGALRVRPDPGVPSRCVSGRPRIVENRQGSGRRRARSGSRTTNVSWR